ncbi:MAG: hypothetical protein JWO12_770 [Frankiales bacterium]|nr:hypothetical protein [Frankiales bacterium]
MSNSRSGRYALLLVSAVVLTGCGSTVQSKGLAPQADGVSQSPLTVPQVTTTRAAQDPMLGTAPVIAPGARTATGTASAPTGSGAATTTSPVTGTVDTVNTVVTGTKTATGPITTTKTVTGTIIKTAAPVVPATGRGWDKDYVYIGVVTQKDVNAVAKQLGLKSIDGGDQEGESTAMANAINANGGIFGRKVKLVFHDLNSNDVVATPETVGASTCQYFAQDRQVVAILSPAGGIDVPSFRACLAKNKIALFSVATGPMDNVIGQSLAPYYYSMAAPSWNSLAPVLVSTLKSQGYFTPWNVATNQAGTAKVKVGVLVGTTDVAARIGNLVANSLRAQGQDVLVLANDPKDFQAAVLKLSGSGVTHLIIPDGGQLAFVLTAATQKYFPRYGLSSVNAPTAVLEPNVPQQFLHGAVGVGWSPSLDVADANDPGDSSIAETTCHSLLSKAGFDFAGRRLAEGIALSYCDGMRIISEGATAGGGLTPLNIYAGVLAIAPTFKSALSFGSGLNATHLTVPGAVRPFRYVDSCSCFRYSSSKNISL